MCKEIILGGHIGKRLVREFSSQKQVIFMSSFLEAKLTFTYAFAENTGNLRNNIIAKSVSLCCAAARWDV